MIKNQLFCSWFGGKDSCLSLYHAVRKNSVLCLTAAMVESGEDSRSHGLSHAVLRAQADALKIPLLIFNTSWIDYETNFKNILSRIKAKHNIDGGIFADTDQEEHKEWCEKLCTSLEMKAHYPLWKRGREVLLSEFIELGFKAKIISVNEKKIHRDFLGRDLNMQLICELREKKIDLCKENAEYHTIVYDGPSFSYPLLLKHGDISLKDGYWFLEVLLG